MSLTNAHTDPDSGLRFYVWQGVEYISVTSSRRMLGMPFTLHNWVVSKVVDRAVDEAEVVISMRDRSAKPRERKTASNAREEARRYVRAAATIDRDLAADIGSATHEAIADGRSPDDPELDPLVKVRLIRWVQFLRATGAKVVWAEKQVFNLTYGYAGSADLLLLIDGEYWLIDTKTGAGVYVDHALQLIAYSTAEFVGENDVIDVDATEALRKVTRMGVLHLTPDAWELVELTPSPRLVEAFRNSVKVALFFHQHPTVESLVASTRTA